MGTVLIAVVLYCLPLNVVKLLYQVCVRIELNIKGGNVKGWVWFSVLPVKTLKDSL